MRAVGSMWSVGRRTMKGVRMVTVVVMMMVHVCDVRSVMYLFRSAYCFYRNDGLIFEPSFVVSTLFDAAVAITRACGVS